MTTPADASSSGDSAAASVIPPSAVSEQVLPTQQQHDVFAARLGLGSVDVRAANAAVFPDGEIQAELEPNERTVSLSLSDDETATGSLQQQRHVDLAAALSRLHSRSLVTTFTLLATPLTEFSREHGGSHVCRVALKARFELRIARKPTVTDAKTRKALVAVLEATTLPEAPKPKGKGKGRAIVLSNPASHSQHEPTRIMHELYASLPQYRPPCAAAPLAPASPYKTYAATRVPDLFGVPLRHLAEYLDARSFEVLAGACKHLHRSLEAHPLGLTLPAAHAGGGRRFELYPHQVKALRWMTARERCSSEQQRRLHRRHQAALHLYYRVRGVAGGTAAVLWVHKRSLVMGVGGEFDPPDIPVVCGGLLCDEPGLGKTITILALVLRSKGRLPTPPSCGALPHTRAEQLTRAEERWRHWDATDRAMRMSRVLRDLQQCSADMGADWFAQPLTPLALAEWGMGDYELVAPHAPQDLASLDWDIRCQRSPKNHVTLQQFSASVHAVFDNAITYHLRTPHACSPRPEIGTAAAQLKLAFDDAMAVLVEQLAPTDRRAARLAALTPSPATLIVVPPPMLEHWITQITTYSIPTYLGAAFFDKHIRQPLPSAQQMANFNIVVTTTSRLSAERENGDASPLFATHFQRMVIDEGHALGGQSWTNYGEVARAIEAERLWIVSGTPTPDTTLERALSHTRSLLAFLRAHQWSDAAEWREHIARQFGDARSAGFRRLARILAALMMRHEKRDLRGGAALFEPPRKELVMLELSPAESMAYDCIAAFVKTNILLTSELQSRTSAWDDSLLNPKQRHSANEAVTNVRLACCGGGELHAFATSKNVKETLAMLELKHHASPPDVARAAEYLRRTNAQQVTGCDGCGRLLQILVLTPCVHLLCFACVRASMYECCRCNKGIDPDDLQLLQPGFNLEWHFPLSARAKAPVGQHEHHTTWQDDLHMHSKAREVIRQLDAARATAQQVQHELAASVREQRRLSAARDTRPVKAIIFSQFRKVLDMVGDKMYRYYGRCPEAGWLERGSEQVAEFFGARRNDELTKFKTSADCFVLLLNMDGSTGLDLSFVTHIYLLEEIWNKALERQVIARAHRLGATGPVKVIQLAMRGTIEETLLNGMDGDNDVPEEEDDEDSGYADAGGGGGGGSATKFRRNSPSRHVHKRIKGDLKSNNTGGASKRDKLQQNKLVQLLRSVNLTPRHIAPNAARMQVGARPGLVVVPPARASEAVAAASAAAPDVAAAALMALAQMPHGNGGGSAWRAPLPAAAAGVRFAIEAGATAAAAAAAAAAAGGGGGSSLQLQGGVELLKRSASVHAPAAAAAAAAAAATAATAAPPARAVAAVVTPVKRKRVMFAMPDED